MGGSGHEQHHVVLFPFMAQGHITPFIALADLLHRRRPELKITIVNTPLNIQSINSSLPPNSTIRLRSLPFSPSDHGLPPGPPESTAGLPSPLHQPRRSLRSFSTLTSSNSSKTSPWKAATFRLRIIADHFLSLGRWRSPGSFGIFHSVLITASCTATGIVLLHMSSLPATPYHQNQPRLLADFLEIPNTPSQLPATSSPPRQPRQGAAFLRQTSHRFNPMPCSSTLSKSLRPLACPCFTSSLDSMGNMEEMMSVKVEREGVKKEVEMVMGGTGKGVEMKKKAMEISEMIRAPMEVNINGVMGSSIQSLEEFFTAFLS
ncbi:hypothetical protein J5N97_023243 [Dioscorea zingiberensis]|uniref:Uncharacterized protein n=1 Tax=Dioscorea zingiberensis TaxID=325984 RepID=A0A9D5HBB9_9LILI|nr:hypothetical protein J5N97_023243 [Dioscorea zingiberensis]